MAKQNRVHTHDATPVAGQANQSCHPLIQYSRAARRPPARFYSAARMFLAALLAHPIHFSIDVLLLTPSHVQPRRIIINGHPTSVRLEPAYWGWLREIAAECGLTAKAFIEGVVAAKDPKCPLASAHQNKLGTAISDSGTGGPRRRQQIASEARLAGSFLVDLRGRTTTGLLIPSCTGGLISTVASVFLEPLQDLLGRSIRKANRLAGSTSP